MLGFPPAKVLSCAFLHDFLEEHDFTTQRNCISLLCLLNPFALQTLPNFLKRLERPWICHSGDCGDEKGEETKGQDLAWGMNCRAAEADLWGQHSGKLAKSS